MQPDRVITPDEHLQGLARYLMSAQQSQAIYPAEHPHTVHAVRDLYVQVTAMLSSREEFCFALADDEFVVDDSLLPADGELLAGLADLMRRRSLGRIVLSRGVRRWELTALIDTLNLNDEELKAGGGVVECLASLGVQHVWAGPLTSGGGGAGVAAGPVSLARAWELYSASLGAMRELKEGLRDGLDHDKLERATGLAGGLVDIVAHQPNAFLLLHTLKTHDDYSYTHSLNVAMLSLTIAHWLDLPQETTQEVALAAILHDVGKALVPDDVLNKPGKLSPEEWEIMQRHGDDGAKMLLHAPVGDLAFIVAHEHQLAYDRDHADYGRWPLHLVSQLVVVADVYDALRSKRPYRDALPPDVAMRIMEDEAATKFDPELFAGFRRMMGYYPPGTCVELTDRSIALARHANPLDPEGPLVLVVRDALGREVEPPEELSLADSELGVARVRDPDDVDVDPLDYLGEA